MSGPHDHSHCVDIWMEGAKNLPSDQLLRSFETAMTALWNRAHVTLGEVTLGAILDRVLNNASDRFPAFAVITIGDSGMDCQELYKETALNNGELREGIRFLMVEFLVVIGNLTGELLTPALHSELSKAMPTKAMRRSEGR